MAYLMDTLYLMDTTGYAVTPEGENRPICEHGRTSWHYTMPESGMDWSQGLGPLCDIWGENQELRNRITLEAIPNG